MPSELPSSSRATFRRLRGPAGVLLLVTVVAALAVLGTLLGRRTDTSSPNPKAAAPSSAASRSESPSPIPSAGPPVAPAGWRTLWQDDFTGPRLDTRRWYRYEGQPSEGRGAWWLPDRVLQSGGQLILQGTSEPSRGGQLVTGGLNSSGGESYAYGRYLVRLRVDPAKEVAYAVLLVPPRAQGGEYVIVASDDGGDRQKLSAGLRTRSKSGAPYAVDHSTRVDLTQWHTVGVDWSPGQLRYTLDGDTWATVRSPLVPSAPLALALQTQAVCSTPGPAGCVETSTAPIQLDVDWVSVMTPTTAAPTR